MKKWTLEDPCSKPCRRVPEVGEAWRHKDGKNIYIRIPDEQGELIMKHRGICGDNRVYSFNPEMGFVWTNCASCGDIEILDMKFSKKC